MFEISLIVNTVLSVLLASFVLHKNSRRRLNRLWALVSLSVALWSASLFMITISDTTSGANFWNHVLYFGAVFVPVFYYHFLLVLLGIEHEQTRSLRIYYGIGILFLILNFSPWFLTGIEETSGFEYWFTVEAGWAYYLFFAYFIYLILLSFYYLGTKYKTLTGYVRHQAKFVFIAGLVGFGGGVTAFLPQLVKVVPFGVVFVSFYVVFITYAIIKYRLMDIRLVMVRSIVYVLLSSFVALIFTALSIFFSSFFER